MKKYYIHHNYSKLFSYNYTIAIENYQGASIKHRERWPANFAISAGNEDLLIWFTTHDEVKRAPPLSIARDYTRAYIRRYVRIYTYTARTHARMQCCIKHARTSCALSRGRSLAASRFEISAAVANARCPRSDRGLVTRETPSKRPPRWSRSRSVDRIAPAELPKCPPTLSTRKISSSRRVYIHKCTYKVEDGRDIVIRRSIESWWHRSTIGGLREQS